MPKAKKKIRKNASKKPRNMTWSHKAVGAGYVGKYVYKVSESKKTKVRVFELSKADKKPIDFASPNAAMKLKWKGAYKA